MLKAHSCNWTPGRCWSAQANVEKGRKLEDLTYIKTLGLFIANILQVYKASASHTERHALFIASWMSTNPTINLGIIIWRLFVTYAVIIVLYCLSVSWEMATDVSHGRHSQGPTFISLQQQSPNWRRLLRGQSSLVWMALHIPPGDSSSQGLLLPAAQVRNNGTQIAGTADYPGSCSRGILQLPRQNVKCCSHQGRAREDQFQPTGQSLEPPDLQVASNFVYLQKSSSCTHVNNTHNKYYICVRNHRIENTLRCHLVQDPA